MAGNPIYGPCENALDCEEGLACVDQSGWVGLDMVSGSWCSKTCMKDEDCPKAAQGTAPAFCEMGVCKLNCDLIGGGMCPAGMECLTDIFAIDACAHVP